MDETTVQSAKANLLDTLNRPTNFNDWLQGAHYSSSYVTQLERTDNACSQAIRSSNAAMAASFKTFHRRPPRESSPHNNNNNVLDAIKLRSSRGAGGGGGGRLQGGGQAQRRRKSSSLSPSPTHDRATGNRNTNNTAAATVAVGSSLDNTQPGSAERQAMSGEEGKGENANAAGVSGEDVQEGLKGDDQDAGEAVGDASTSGRRRRRRPIRPPRKAAEEKEEEEEDVVPAAPMNSAEIRDHLRESYYQMKTANAFGNTFPALLTPLNRPVFHVYDEPDLPNRYRPGVGGFGGGSRARQRPTLQHGNGGEGGSSRRPNQEWHDMTRGMMTGRSYDYPYQNEVLNQTCLRNLLVQPGGPPAFYPSATRPRRGGPRETGPYYV